MKYFYRCCIISVLSLFSIVGQINAQSVIDTNFSSFKTIYLPVNGQTNLVLDTNMYRTHKDSVYFSQSLFSCTDIGDSVFVTLSITDTSVVPAQTYYSKSTDFWSVDLIAPVINYKASATVYMKQNGTAKLLFSDVDAGTWDSCGLSISTFQLLTQTDFFCADVGSKKVNARVADIYGNIASDSILVNIVDTIKPVANLKSDTVYLSGFPLAAQITFADVNNGSSDNCAIDSATVNGLASVNFGCADLGENKVFVKILDVSGNITLDSTSVFIMDTAGFNYTKNPISVYLIGDSVAVYSDSIIKITPGGCASPNLTVTSDSVFSCADLANNPNFIHFTLSNGSISISDSIAVTVLDSISPTLALKTDTFYFSATGLNLIFGDLDNGSFDNCALDSATLNGNAIAAFSCGDTGIQNINVVLYDVSGNSSAGMVSVFLVDTISISYTTSPFTAYLQGSATSISRGDLIADLSGGCGNSAQFNFVSDTTFGCSDVYSNPNYVVFTISTSGTSVTDSVPVTVLDTLGPQLDVYPIDTVYLSGIPLTASLNFGDLDINTTDNCGIDSATVNGFSQLDYGCSDTGMQQVVISVWDVNGNESRDTSIVYVLDTIAPTYSVQPATLYLIGNSTAVHLDSIIQITGGGCSPPQLTVLSDTTFDCADVYQNPNYIRFIINSGSLQIQDSVAVTVLDTVKPTLVLQSDTLVMGSNGYTLDFASIDAGSADNCGLDTALLNGGSSVYFSCADTGLANIQVVLYDVNGNSQTSALNVYIIDTLGPGYTPVPFTAYLQSGSTTISRSDILTNVTGGCGTALSINLLSDTLLTCADVNSNPHYIVFSIATSTFSVTDSVPVTVLDTLGPQVDIRTTDTIYLSGMPLAASLNFSDLDINTADNCGIDSATVNGLLLLNYTCADTGMQEVLVQVWDFSGNESIDTAVVYVLDTVASQYTKVPQVLYLHSGMVSTSIDSLVTNLSGGCQVPIVTALSDTVFDCSDVFTSPQYVSFSVSNGAFFITDSVAITVLDTVKPTLNIPASDTLIIFGTSLKVSFADLDLGSFDNCSLDSATLNGLDTLVYGCSDLGSHTLVVNLYDVNGNVSSGNINLFLEDTVSPSYLKTPFTAYLVGDSASVSRSDILDNISGGCSGAASSLSIISDTVFDCSDALNNPHWVQFSIAAGGFSILDSVKVTVLDTLSPTFTTKAPQTVYLDSLGQRVLTAADLINGIPQDNCGISSVLITPPVLTCSNTGQFSPVAIQVLDVHGNSTTKFMFVLAVDSMAPVLVTQPTTVYLDSITGTYTLQQSDVVQSLSDNCGIQSVIISPSSFSCADTGVVSITITATDVNANVTARTVSVLVLDTLAPVITPLLNPSIYLDQNGLASVSLIDLLVSPAFDACTITDTLISQTNFDCADVSPNPKNIQISLMDGNGNESTAVVALTVSDTIHPTIVPKSISISLDSTGMAIINPADVTDSVYDNCAISSLFISPNSFVCDDVGTNVVTITASDQHGNQTTEIVNVTVVGPNSGTPSFTGPTEVCRNNTAVYAVDNPDTNSYYQWSVKGGTVLATSFAGRFILVQWTHPSEGTISLRDEFASNCFSDSTVKNISISGLAPDVAEIDFWDPSLMVTLVIKDLNSTYYQWGYDVLVNNTLVSDTLFGETKTSYTNTSIPDNLTLGYKYWCQTSFNGSCWTRSYLDTSPIGIEEREMAEVNIWPNPMGDQVNIEASVEISRIDLYDITGKLLITQKEDVEGKGMLLSGLQILPPATYVIQVLLKDGSVVNQRLIRVE